MKPKTKLEQDAARLTAKLPVLSQRQREEASLAAGSIFVSSRHNWCSGCNHVWEDPRLWRRADKLQNVRCPHCGKVHGVTKTTPVKHTDSCKYYYTSATTCGGYQVIRNFFCDKSVERGHDKTLAGEVYATVKPSVNLFIKEVSQIWLTPDCEHRAIIGRSAHGAMFYNDIWNFDSEMTVKRNQHARYFYTGYADRYSRFLPEIRRCGITSIDDELNAYRYIANVVTDPFAESLQKHHQKSLLREYIDGHYYYKFNDDIKASIRVVMRHGYAVKDARMFLDYLEDLQKLGRDIHNPHFVCPADLRAAHAETQRRIDVLEERRRRETERQQIIKDKKVARQYELRMLAFAGIVLRDGSLTITAIPTVEEVAEEGRKMHHCVFANGYYKDKNALLMTARINGKRTETVEFDIRNGRVAQSRGLQNALTDYHTRILRLVEKNATLLQRTARQKAAEAS